MASLIASQASAEIADERPTSLEQPELGTMSRTLEAALADAKMRTWEFFESYERLGNRLLTNRQHRVENMSKNRSKLNLENTVLLAHLESNSQRVADVLQVTLVLNAGDFRSAKALHAKLDELASNDQQALEKMMSEIRSRIPKQVLEVDPPPEQKPLRNPAWDLD